MQTWPERPKISYVLDLGANNVLCNKENKL
jgi:hypothetical protein